jgi:hypothetical protein
MNQVGTGSATTNLVLARPLSIDHEATEVVIQYTCYDLGPIAGAGATPDLGAAQTDVRVANSLLLFGTQPGFVDPSLTIPIEGFSLWSLAWAWGMSLTSMGGSGVFASPSVLQSDGTEFMQIKNGALCLVYQLADGSVQRLEYWGVSFDYSTVNFRFAIGQEVVIPVKGWSDTGAALYDGADPYAAYAVTTYTPSKANLADLPLEVGLLVDSVATTLATDAAAAANALTLTSGTGFLASVSPLMNYLRIGTGNRVEYHAIDSVTGAAVVLKSTLKRRHLATEPVVFTTRGKLAGLGADGVGFTSAGTLEPRTVGSNRVRAGRRRTTVDVAFDFKIQNLTPANFAAALGIAPSEIRASGTQLYLGSNIQRSNSAVSGVYFRATLQNGDNIWATAWGCSSLVAALLGALAAGGAPALTFNVRPSSGFQFLQFSP